MLHYETLDQPTLELLKKLMLEPAFGNLRLVGGTALALGLGHRKSIDIDLFGTMDIDKYTLSQKLNRLGMVTILQETENIHIYSINNIKVDLVNYPYPWLADAEMHDGIRLADLKDIAAMKLAAITGRGSRKDFIDIFFLLQHFSLDEMLNFYKDKFADGSVFLAIKSLTYFEDADMEQSPVMLHSISWDKVKETIIAMAVNL